MSISRSKAQQSLAGRGRTRRGLRQSLPLPGFTLIEVMVVVAIIVILMSLLVMAMGARSKGPEIRTRVVLSGLKAIADEYLVTTNMIIADGPATSMGGMAPPGGYPDELEKNAPGADNALVPADEASSIELFVWTAMQNPDLAGLLSAQGVTIFVDKNENGLMEVLDGWGNPLVYAVSGDSDPLLPDHPRPFFASAGADGVLGTDDDMYSFNLE